MRKINKPLIILASKSPRRLILLKNIGLEFKTLSIDFDEKINPRKSAVANARSLARAKAKLVQAKLNNPQVLIIAADTIVVLGNQILGKPKNKKEAVSMLTRLSGKTHRVITALCLTKGKKTLVDHEITKVSFHLLSQSIIRDYVKSDEPMDKAGAYGIQEKGDLLVKKIKGDYFNVVGLPLVKLIQMLNEFGIGIP